MHTITLMNQKGGAGKSTAARTLLSAGDATGLRCAFIDADQTGNLADWAMRSAEAGLWAPAFEAYQTHDAQEAEEIAGELAAEGAIDLLLIDTAGDASRDHDAYATLADLILCPMLLSQSDLETARGTANYLFRMRSRTVSPHLLPEFRVVLNRLPSRPSAGDARLVRTVHSSPLVGVSHSEPEEHLKLLSASLQEREAYKMMDREGLLGRILTRHNDQSEAFAKNPKHILNAVAEAEELLSACLELMKGPRP
ncbi:hypothetical protein RA19_18645 [Leisingera sp. ANG-M1]|uniref:ParA family protein n=1 Tax=Leisingera sp. ANG-M1 TaxID=1577895 RepID=UPI00057FE253|nr:ParA family protein [Leisingera sp. ANG-M1]KIC08870.1 hypothetical protein RA19_18645 [Leisingera sp. ANG-M1]